MGGIAAPSSGRRRLLPEGEKWHVSRLFLRIAAQGAGEGCPVGQLAGSPHCPGNTFSRRTKGLMCVTAARSSSSWKLDCRMKKSRKPWPLVLVLIVTTAYWDLRAADAEPNAKPPNFLFLLVDDLGWADVGCFGSTFYETPHIDRLASRGMRFSQAYAACPVCSPTRASIMTGRHPVRVDITDWIPGMSADRFPDHRFLQVMDRDNLALEEVTIAEILKQRGYRTFFAGKWHLGNQGHWPTDQGFDVNVGGNEKGSPPGGYYAPWSNPTLTANRDGEYLTERLTEEAISFLQSHARSSESPFLLYLAYYNVHAPITPYRKRFDHFQQKSRRFRDATPTEAEHLGESRLRKTIPHMRR